MAASLIPTEGGSPIALDKPIMLIGRNQDCDIALQVSSKISRRHCCIVQCGERYVLRDLGSMNGVRVNRERVVESPLKAGDEISVADVTFTFRLDEGRSARTERDLSTGAPRQPAPVDEPDPADGAFAEAADPEPEEVNPSRTYSEERDLDNEARQKDDSESEAGFV